MRRAVHKDSSAPASPGQCRLKKFPAIESDNRLHILIAFHRNSAWQAQRGSRLCSRNGSVRPALYLTVSAARDRGCVMTRFLALLVSKNTMDRSPDPVDAPPTGGVWEGGLVVPADVEQEEGSTQRTGRAAADAAASGANSAISLEAGGK